MSRTQSPLRALLLVLTFASVWGACASQAEPTLDLVEAPESLASPPELAAIERHLYPPDLVMDNQGALGLDETQRVSVLDEVRNTQESLVELDANLRRDTEALGTLLEVDPIDETAALAAAATVMAWENQIKTAHLRLLLRIKNLLSAEQRAQLDRLR